MSDKPPRFCQEYMGNWSTPIPVDETEAIDRAIRQVPGAREVIQMSAVHEKAATLIHFLIDSLQRETKAAIRAERNRPAAILVAISKEEPDAGTTRPQLESGDPPTEGD